MVSKNFENGACLNDVKEINKEVLDQIAAALIATRRSSLRSQFVNDALQEMVLRILQKQESATPRSLPNRFELIRLALQRLSSITRTECRETKRRQKAAAEHLESEMWHSDYPDPEAIDSLLECVKSLDHREQDFINRRYLEVETGATPTYSQLAKEDGIDPEIVSDTMKRAYRKLKRCFENKGFRHPSEIL